MYKLSSFGSSKTSTSRTTFGWSSFFRMAISLYTRSIGARGRATAFPSLDGGGRPVKQFEITIVILLKVWLTEIFYPIKNISGHKKIPVVQNS